MSEERTHLALILSALLHAAGLFLFIMLAKENAKKVTQTISDVDLLVPIHKTLPLSHPSVVKRFRPKPKQVAFKNMKDFLKLALPAPAAPKPQAPKALSIALPEEHHLMAAAPKIEDRGRMHSRQKLTSHLDMSRKELPQNAAFKENFNDSHHEQMAQLPRLEEIGQKRAPQKLLNQIALQDAQEQNAPMGIADSNILPDNHAHVAVQEAPLEEASPEPLHSHHISADIPESSIKMAPQNAPMPSASLSADDLNVKTTHPTTAASLKSGGKKGIDIEGPLANRNVISYNIPKFPDWALKQGIPESSVSIRFWVSPDGKVLPNLRIERTSGFGRLDRLAMEALKKWRFAPIKTQEKEWGVITFRFLLD